MDNMWTIFLITIWYKVIIKMWYQGQCRTHDEWLI